MPPEGLHKANGRARDTADTILLQAATPENPLEAIKHTLIKQMRLRFQVRSGGA